VVGVVLNLSVGFAPHAVFAGVATRRFGSIYLEVSCWPTLQGVAALIALAALVAMLRLRPGMGWILLGSGLAAAIWLQVIRSLL